MVERCACKILMGQTELRLIYLSPCNAVLSISKASILSLSICMSYTGMGAEIYTYLWNAYPTSYKTQAAKYNHDLAI